MGLSWQSEDPQDRDQEGSGRPQDPVPECSGEYVQSLLERTKLGGGVAYCPSLLANVIIFSLIHEMDTWH